MANFLSRYSAMFNLTLAFGKQMYRFNYSLTERQGNNCSHAIVVFNYNFMAVAYSPFTINSNGAKYNCEDFSIECIPCYSTCYSYDS